MGPAKLWVLKSQAKGVSVVAVLFDVAVDGCIQNISDGDVVQGSKNAQAGVTFGADVEAARLVWAHSLGCCQVKYVMGGTAAPWHS